MQRLAWPCLSCESRTRRTARLHVNGSRNGDSIVASITTAMAQAQAQAQGEGKGIKPFLFSLLPPLTDFFCPEKNVCSGLAMHVHK